MKSKSIEVDLGKIQIDMETDAKAMTCTMHLAKWRIGWALIKAGIKLLFT